MVQTVWAVRTEPLLDHGVFHGGQSQKAAPPFQEFTPLFLNLLASRGFNTFEQIETFLYPPREGFFNPFLMKGMRQAVERIRRAQASCEKVLIHGDYDVDGITGAAIVSLALGRLGVSHETFLPERSRDGYGVSQEAIRKAAHQGIRLLITVDCGISAKEEIEEASHLGIDAIVLDHHQIPCGGLPPAESVLNPLQGGCAYPFKELSAGGLAFKLAQALLGEGAFEYLDLATLSTVADLAPLVGENRIIVREGLCQLSARRRIGIKALLEAAGLRSQEIRTGHVGFVLGPRINASGRMSSALTALRLLLTPSEREARSLARILEEENKRRQQEERRVVREAVEEVERTVNFAKERVLVVAREGWHQGVIGIVASRLVERYHRPSLVIALEGNEGKGSGRSIRSFHLFKALAACRESLLEFGGHEQAAGFTLRRDQIPSLRKRLNEHSRAVYPAEIFLRSIDIDLEIALSDLRPIFLRELELLEPFGVGNPKPVFLTRGLQVKNAGTSLRLQRQQAWVTDGSLTYEVAISERSGIPFDFEAGACLDLVYTLGQRRWAGEMVPVLEAKDAKWPS